MLLPGTSCMAPSSIVEEDVDLTTRWARSGVDHVEVLSPWEVSEAQVTMQVPRWVAIP